MPPRLNLFTARKAAAALRQPTVSSITARNVAGPLRFRAEQSAPVQKRWSSSKDDKKVNPIDEQKFPTQDPLPHVSQEAAEVDRIMSKEKSCDGQPTAPELEQGSPVSEILSRDKEAMKHMPKVMQDQFKKNKRSFSTSARSHTPDMHSSQANDEASAAMLASMIQGVEEQASERIPGLKFGKPEAPRGTINFRKRYDTMQDQFTKMLMQDGKLARAQKQKGIAGGGTAVQVPHPLTLRQRRRTAIKWIIDGSEKRRDAQLAHRVANELIAIAEGRSGVWDRRDGQHKIVQPTKPAQLTTHYLPRPATPPHFLDRTPLLSSAQLLALGRFPSGPPTTVAPSPGHESFELADFNTATGSVAGASRTASARTQRSQRASRPLKPAVNSQSLAGFRPRPDRDWEKTVASDQRPRAPRSSRLRFWAEALRRRAHLAGRGQADVDPETAAKMKFSHSIQFNAVPDWSSNYIAYSNLKKLIYTLEKQVNRPDEPTAPDVESAPLLSGSQVHNPDGIFKHALDAELDKICTFFQSKQEEIFELTNELMHDATSYISETDGVNMDPVSESVVKARTMSTNSRPGTGYGQKLRRQSSAASEDADDSDDEHYPPVLNSRNRLMQSTDEETTTEDRAADLADSAFFGLGSSRGPQDSDLSDQAFLDLYNTGVSLKKRLVEAYVSLCGLRSFIELNKTGFSKALKKYDKTLFRSMRREYLNSVVAPALPFTESTMAAVDSNIDKVEGAYADIVTKGSRALASRELRLHLREHVVWERNTVWREMIEIERRAQAANVGIRHTLLGGDEDPATARRQGDKQEIHTKEIGTPLGRIQFPLWLCSLSFGTLIFSIAIFGALLATPLMETPEQQNCLAMLVLVSILWATEAIPLFVTSLLIPFLVVVLGIMRSEAKPHKRLGPKEAVGQVFSAMWTPVIMLLLGGFTIAAALSKYDIARRMAMFVLSKAGSKPKIVLLTNMFVSMFLSMWISNVASPVLCYSIIQPLLRNLSPDSNFAKALVLGIALAANVGGAASPIASPQNIIALQNMYPSISWGTWFFVSLPICIISILLIWGLLLATFHPGRNTTIIPMRPVKDRFTGIQYFISAVTVGTIILWCVSHQLEHVFGDMGVIAIIPLVLFFGTGILNKEDFNNFLWTIIILAAGGLCLGKAVTSSGLLHTIAGSITDRVEHLSLYSVLLVFSALILVIATFISHTVAALIILPLVRQIGVNMENPHPNLLVMASALMCSVAMALPTSGFPNMTAIMTEVPTTGQRYLQVRHFLTRGTPSSLMAFVVIVTIGYGLMYIAGL
ncbi:hypothetical protein N7532_010718 [Penicillium argentinense]|uniref:SPX domain-containing protein n=1 Tax=Penicillium argentinense TaxID=1131581 RepID=A0A9W9EQ45_9EURO|nr:uncharacterized protein N7532_010718 [Penicillium argentinense]KAJ5085947.1 hypothetical protein N7532_010718 [Penicillium argentinense]